MFLKVIREKNVQEDNDLRHRSWKAYTLFWDGDNWVKYLFYEYKLFLQRIWTPYRPGFLNLREIKTKKMVTFYPSLYKGVVCSMNKNMFEEDK